MLFICFLLPKKATDVIKFWGSVNNTGLAQCIAGTDLSIGNLVSKLDWGCPVLKESPELSFLPPDYGIP
jgi:hypothetical protein